MAIDRSPQDSTLPISVFREYGAQLHRFLLRRLTRPQDADDLAQEVFMRLARMERPELVRKPHAYLFSVASNLIREFRLRTNRDRACITYDSDMVEQLSESSSASRDELAEQLDVERRLERALSLLPRKHRAVLLLVKRDGLSHKEVARRTGLNVRTVERYVMEAVARMMTMYREGR